ncbi:biosynthetic peptidoglycan transglycosylase [Marinomonas shanghaiensis]|uniref:biosynthetic peptidoglycan transglycosylase n=1 Tax=Marinomonas shanghaiensis TaxID=2202418 RepID=UPI000DB9643B|nr:biosynthetic peptidoglycan transglycosylase [Marinomonas shanghaiensis]
MIHDDQNEGWKQHFPTYHFSERDIALEEYSVAAKALESEERVFLNASNITLVAAATLGSLAVSSTEKLSNTLDSVLPSYSIPLVLLLMVSLFSLVSIRYFADRQRAIIFASRKVVTLRRMLGLSYGRIHLVLPNWRIEGADQPLSIRLFPGWFTYASYPFWILLIISSCICFLLSALLVKSIELPLVLENSVLFILSTNFIWITILTYTFRSSLLDTHESMRLLFTKVIGNFIRLPIASNIEYLVYRATLATYETDRMKVSLTKLIKLLIFIEDRSFYQHSGVSFKAIFRGLLSLFNLKRRSGGSTIHQQLIRTLFILDLKKTKRRKAIEILLAPWLNKILKKQQILEIYLSSVRFENKCFGVIPAMNYFFGSVITNPTSAQAFFLIERVSNIRQSLLTNKVIATAKSAVKNKVLSQQDLNELALIYKESVIKGNIIDHNNSIDRLISELTSE